MLTFLLLINEKKRKEEEENCGNYRMIIFSRPELI